MTKWEYLVMPLKDAARLKKDSDGLAPDRLNELGSEGWEAVGVSLKREISSPGRCPAQASRGGEWEYRLGRTAAAPSKGRRTDAVGITSDSAVSEQETSA